MNYLAVTAAVFALWGILMLAMGLWPAGLVILAIAAYCVKFAGKVEREKRLCLSYWPGYDGIPETKDHYQ